MLTDYIMIKNARASFVHLFTKPIINGEEASCGARLMLDPKEHKSPLADIGKSMKELAKEKFKGRMPGRDKLCLTKGEDSNRPEYDGWLILGANSKSRPVVLATNGRTVIESESDSKIYSGCRVNAKVRLWPQDNKWGKRINCELVAIQFAADDNPLDSAHVPVEEAIEGFGAIEGDDFGDGDILDNDDADDMDFLGGADEDEDDGIPF